MAAIIEYLHAICKHLSGIHLIADNALLESVGTALVYNLRRIFFNCILKFTKIRP